MLNKLKLKICGPNFRFPNGINFSHKNEMPMPKLLEYLKAVSSFLKNHTEPEELYVYSDWLQHDGLHFFGRTIGFNELDEMLLSSDILRSEAPDDFKVYLGIGPKDMTWYLRVYAQEIDEDEDGDNGYFDISLAETLSEGLYMTLSSVAGTKFIKTKSPEYYDEIKVNR